jgi:hypothetical protein
VKTTPALFRVRTSDGLTVLGHIHGNGGVISDTPDALTRLTLAIRRADRGHATGIYEPEPFHCRMYLHETAESRSVDLRGATVEVIAGSDSPQTEMLL